MARIASYLWAGNDSITSIRSAENGLAEGAVRSFKMTVLNICGSMTDSFPFQENLARSAIAKNHAPRSATGIPPALAMTGRCDILSVYSHAAFNRAPEIDDSVMEIQNNMRNVTNARIAVIFAAENRAGRTMLSRKSTGPFPSHFSVGSSVKIALRQSLTGTYRVLEAMGSHLILERAARVSKWPKCKSRTIRDKPIERPDTADTAPDSTENPTSENYPPIASPDAPLGLQTGSDSVFVPSESLVHPDVTRSKLYYDSENPNDTPNYPMVRHKDNYCRIHPGSITSAATKIIALGALETCRAI